MKHPTKADAHAVLKLYDELLRIDRYIEAIKVAAPSWGSIIMNVKFYMCEGGYSGPVEYDPTSVKEPIRKLVLRDMIAKRAGIVSQIAELGFDPT